MNIPNLPQTTSDTAKPAVEEKKEASGGVELKSTVTKATKGTSPSQWHTRPYKGDLILAQHSGGELLVGTIKEFNEHLKAA